MHRKEFLFTRGPASFGRYSNKHDYHPITEHASSSYHDMPKLHDAARNGNVQEIEMLVEIKGFNINFRDGYGQTPLHCAAMESQTTALSTLINLGADTMTINNRGDKPRDLLTYPLQIQFDNFIQIRNSHNLNVLSKTILAATIVMPGDICMIIAQYLNISGPKLVDITDESLKKASKGIIKSTSPNSIFECCMHQ